MKAHDFIKRIIFNIPFFISQKNKDKNYHDELLMALGGYLVYDEIIGNLKTCMNKKELELFKQLKIDDELQKLRITLKKELDNEISNRK